MIWRRRRSFTLIELLTVIAIVAILAVLAQASLRNVTMTMHVTKCQTNLRSAYIALYQFAVDRTAKGNCLPSGHWGESVCGICPPDPGNGGGEEQGGAYPSEVTPYGFTRDVVRCPGIDAAGRTQRSTYWYYEWPDNRGFDYVYRGGRGNHPFEVVAWMGYFAQNYYFLTPSRIVSATGIPVNPGEAVFMSDVSYNQAGSYPGWYHGVTEPSNHPLPGTIWWQARGSNRLYADGHSAWFTWFKWYPPGYYFGWLSCLPSQGPWVGDYYTPYW